jgi:hypothetical protein
VTAPSFCQAPAQQLLWKTCACRAESTSRLRIWNALLPYREEICAANGLQSRACRSNLPAFVARAPLGITNGDTFRSRVCRYTFLLVFVPTVASESCVRIQFGSACSAPSANRHHSRQVRGGRADRG